MATGGAGDLGAQAGDVDAAGEAFVTVANRSLLAARAPVTPPQLRALLVLRQQPGINAAGLAEQLGVKPPTATAVCDRLEAAGLMDRQVAPHSRREVVLRLTRAGHRLLAGLARQRREDVATVLARMSAPDRQALLVGLTAFRRAVVEGNDLTSSAGA